MRTTINMVQSERFQIFVNRNGGLSAVSKITGISVQRMSNYIRGDNKTLSTDVVAAIMKAYPNFNIGWWLNGEGEYHVMSEEKLVAQLITSNPSILDDLNQASGILTNLIDKIHSYKKPTDS